MIIHKEFGEERNSVVEFSSQNRAIIRTQLQELESKNGYDLPEYHNTAGQKDNVVQERVLCVTVVKVISEKSL